VTRSALAVVAACLLILALCSGAAQATVTIDSFETSRTMIQAGAHPSLTASFSFGASGGSEAVKSVDLGAPAGFFVNPTAVPACAGADFAAFECSPSSQVGLITLRADHGGNPTRLLGTAPVFALAPGAGAVARFGFVAPILNTAIEIPVRARSSSDYGPTFGFQDLPPATPLTSAALTLWDVPADPQYDSGRFAAGSTAAPAGCPEAESASCVVAPTASNGPAIPLLHNPTTCPGGPISSRLDVTTHQHPDNVLTATTTMIGNTGCGNNGFTPILLAGLTTAQTRSASDLSLDLLMVDPGFFTPGSLDQAQIQSASLALPAGFEIDAGSTAALSTCSDTQFAPGSGVPSNCPFASQVGPFSLAVAGLDAPLDGLAYFGSPEPNGTYRILLTASGSGIDAKLVALLRPGTDGGPVTFSLSNLPQLPLEELQLDLAAGPGLLVTPARCDSYLAQGTIAPWSSPSAPAWLTVSTMALTSTGPGAGPCPGPATDVDLSLAPSSILANGNSTSVAIATVADPDGIPVPADDIAFSSSDPGQRISAVTDNRDGAYTVRITASTAVGAATITAVDTSVSSPPVGTATLTQFVSDPPSPTPTVLSTPSALRQPLATLTRKPARQGHDRTPTLRFSSSQPGSTFSCKLDNRPFRPCSSPKILPKLGLGPHSFSVRAISPAGLSSEPMTCRFTVGPRPIH
jgi:hypothetical protein